MTQTETVYVAKPKVHCDGGKGSLGHPLVYLELGEKNEISCPYCGKHFVLRKQA